MNAGRVAGLQNDGTRAIAKQHAGTTILPVENAREGFSTNDQGTAMRTRADELISHRQSVDKAATYRLQIKGRSAVAHAEFVLQDGGRAGENVIRR